MERCPDACRGSLGKLKRRSVSRFRPNPFTFAARVPRAALPAAPLPSRGLGYDIDLQRRIGGGNVRCGQAQLATDQVAALGDGRGLVKGDLPGATLAAEAAIAGDDQPFRRDVLQSPADFSGHVLGAVGLERAMADRADGHLLLQVVLEGLEELDVFEAWSFISTVQTSPRHCSRYNSIEAA